MRRTKIVAPIGPASRDPEVLVQMIDAGMDVARLNFSHGSAEEHAETAQRVRDAANRAGRSVAILPGDGEIDAVVEIGGSVASRQGLNIPGETAALPSLPEEDITHVATGEKIGVDLVAISFVRRAEDVESLRKHTRLPLIAK